MLAPYFFIKQGSDFLDGFLYPIFLPAEPLGNAGAAIKLFEGSFTFKI